MLGTELDAIEWLEPTNVYAAPRAGSEANRAVYQQLAQRDGFAWKALCERVGIAPSDDVHFGLVGFSAFHGFASSWLANPEDRSRTRYVHLADACFMGAGATKPFSSFAAYAELAMRMQARMVVTSNGPWGKDIHYEYQGKKYDLTSGAKCVKLFWDAALKQTGVEEETIEALALVREPTRCVRAGAADWYHYESLGHAIHVHELMVGYVQAFGPQAMVTTPAALPNLINPQPPPIIELPAEVSMWWDIIRIGAISAAALLAIWGATKLLK